MFVLLFVAVGGMVGSLVLCLAHTWRLKHKPKTPIYVWPIPGRHAAEQITECGNLAASIQTIRGHDITKFAAMWESGLGKEFPSMGRN